ncbi:flavonol sulfotransferase-like [Tripterygium wilfordii]|uniref:flavonol sulfotransferase-like n=1 Tax=Tripterygium wilfordii TaxID=458696 RepID=UPI0018F848E2|nr:flavonol sulfotransferase-like [Tripterygium wilfordii]
MESSKSSEEENQESSPFSQTDDQYKDIIATIPRTKGLGFITPDLCLYQDFWYEPKLLEGIMSAQQHFKPQSNDIIVSSFPKSGTTWLKALTFSIATRAIFSKTTTSPLFIKLPHVCVPHLDLSTNRETDVPIMATHIPYDSLPNSIVDSGNKIVYICRNPKDVFVSTWHFIPKVMQTGFKSFPLEEAFELFCNGLCVYGPWWEHNLGYWKASLELPEKVLFLKYDEMRKEPQLHIKRLAEFMGYPFSMEEDQNGAVQNIINICSFDHLSNLEVNRNGKCFEGPPAVIPNSAFFRKGSVGDWKNHLTVEMAARFDSIMDLKFSGSGLNWT